MLLANQTKKQRTSNKIFENEELKLALDMYLDSNVAYRKIKELLEQEFSVKISLSEIAVYAQQRQAEQISRELSKIEVNEEEIRSLTRPDALKRERIENQVLAVKIRKLIQTLIDTNKWLDIRPDFIKALADIYKTATAEARLGTAEEFRQLQNEENDALIEILKYVKGLDDDDSENT